MMIIARYKQRYAQVNDISITGLNAAYSCKRIVGKQRDVYECECERERNTHWPLSIPATIVSVISLKKQSSHLIGGTKNKNCFFYAPAVRLLSR